MKNIASTVIEEYLQIIYQFQIRDETLKSMALAECLDTSPSTVHATLQRMMRDSLIRMDDKKQIFLTEEGRKVAENIKFRHNLAEYFLCNTLGIPWYDVHVHAHRLEHAMTSLVTEKLAEFLGFPHACPHGSPMPEFRKDFLKDAETLDMAQENAEIKIVMIDEKLEESRDMLKHLHDKNMLPGVHYRIKERSDVTHSMLLEASDHQVMIPFDLARSIWVTSVD
ncbi:MAG: metal-dependent transcriptional regulator [SAR324 cluster bacterium]|nr:metal-dependent transcriptional regulator [SAR324 cluster bacterium]